MVMVFVETVDVIACDLFRPIDEVGTVVAVAAAVVVRQPEPIGQTVRRQARRVARRAREGLGHDECESRSGSPRGEDVRTILESLDPKAPDSLRRVLIRDRADRYEVAMQLLRHRDDVGYELADFIDTLTMNADQRRTVVRLLCEIDARG